MKMRKINAIQFILFCFALFFFSTSLASELEEVNKQVMASIKAGSAHDLSGFFSSRIDLGISGAEDTYSRDQAVRLLGDFFSRNAVKAVKITQEGDLTDGSHFYICELSAGNKLFRLYYLLKKDSGRYMIPQFQVQEQNK
jgi:hypothetical protein